MLKNRLGSIPSDFYFRQDILDLEIENIFKKSWLCVGFTQDLLNHNDYVTAAIGSCGLVVQNFHGELKAFRNVCTHRFCRIQTTTNGNRSLQCPYHGWTFDSSGVPVGLPMNREGFGFDNDDKKQLRLHSYHLETVGHFVFIRMCEDGPTLRGFLGDFYDDLLHVSQICPDRFETLSFEWQANWKVGMDNAAEGYHVPLVHPNTFGVILPLDLKITVDAEHSRYTGHLKEQSLRWWRNVQRAIDLMPSAIYPEYANFLIFPNIVITYSYGAFLTVQTFDPLSTDSLRINTNAWLACNNGRVVREMVLESLRTFSAAVRNEDRDICAQVQPGLRDVMPPRGLVLGELEGRITHFQKAYMSRMNPVKI